MTFEKLVGVLRLCKIYRAEIIECPFEGIIYLRLPPSFKALNILSAYLHATMPSAVQFLVGKDLKFWECRKWYGAPFVEIKRHQGPGVYTP